MDVRSKMHQQVRPAAGELGLPQVAHRTTRSEWSLAERFVSGASASADTSPSVDVQSVLLDALGLPPTANNSSTNTASEGKTCPDLFLTRGGSPCRGKRKEGAKRPEGHERNRVPLALARSVAAGQQTRLTQGDSKMNTIILKLLTQRIALAMPPFRPGAPCPPSSARRS